MSTQFQPDVGLQAATDRSHSALTLGPAAYGEGHDVKESVTHVDPGLELLRSAASWVISLGERFELIESWLSHL